MYILYFTAIPFSNTFSVYLKREKKEQTVTVLINKLPRIRVKSMNKLKIHLLIILPYRKL